MGRIRSNQITVYKLYVHTLTGMRIDVTVVDLKDGGDGLADNRPSFKEIKSFEEFNQYYWYREEISQICKSLLD